MVYNKFYFQLIARIFIIILVVTGMAFLFVYKEYIKLVFALLLFTFLVFELIKYVNKSNKDFQNFLHSLANNDFTARYSNNEKGNSFSELNQTYQKISHQFNRLNFDRELQFQHLRNLVEHIDIGIISFDKDEKIHLINQAFKKLTSNPFIEINQKLTKLNRDFAACLKDMEHGDTRLFKIHHTSQTFELSLSASRYNLKNKAYKLVSVKNIQNELDSKEQESYQKLISVLTHEIMNSVSPILSLSSTLEDNFKAIDENKLSNKAFYEEGLNAIVDRSRNLLDFTHQYRKLTKIPNPVKSHIDILKIVSNIQKLFNEEIQNHKIEFEVKKEDGIDKLNIDESLMEQALINIYKNAIEALNETKNPQISTRLFEHTPGEICLQIKDNGKGIEPDILSKVFVPFFTNKEEGSGIGLSLCKQIVKLHGGRISINSKPKEFTSISIYLPEK